MPIEIEETFYSLGEFLRAANEDSILDDEDRESRNHSQENWGAVESYEEAEELIKKGWDEGADRFKEVVKNMVVTTEAKEYHPVHAVTGSQINMGRHMAGVPESMVQYETREREGENEGIIRVGVNAAASWSIDDETIMRRGAAVVSLVRTLQRSGMDVEVWVEIPVSSYGNDYLVSKILVKRSDHYLDLDRIAYAVAHPSLLRRIMFSYEETFDKETMKTFGIGPYMGGYGSPSNLRGEYDVELEKMSTRERRWENDENTVNWIIQELKMQGVEVDRTKI